MKHVFMYFAGQDPMRKFWEDCMPVKNFCFFTTYEGVVKHLYREWVDEFIPEDQDNIDWASAHIWNMTDGEVDGCKDADELSSETLTEFHKRFVLWFGEEWIFGIPTDPTFKK